MTEAWTRTTCPYCGVGCGVLVKPSPDGLSAEVRGDPEHPANFGRLCSKGSALGETLALDDRLLTPIVDGHKATWDEALNRVATAFAEAIALHGPDSVALYVSGQILTEDYYVANKLMKGYIGTGNIDTNSRLCMASSVAGHKRAFGTDTVPGTYEDIEIADLVVLFGSNMAWCHPVLYQRLVAAREKHKTRIIAVDPRVTATCDIADLHLRIAPGTDVALLNGLLAHLDDTGCTDRAYVEAHTAGVGEALKAARAMSLEEIASLTGLDPADILEFYESFANTPRVVTIYSQGVNQSSVGTDKVNAIINCHLLTGRIGKPGCGPFSVTGQPNAMGGREAGGLANMLAAHMEINDPHHRQLVQAFWNSPTIASEAGLKAVDLFEAVGRGEIKALWIMATSPVDSLPDADRVREAIASCPFVVVSDVTGETDTAELAHVLLPAAAWGEKTGTVTNSERRISRQRSFLTPPGEARPDWWQVCEVAEHLGFGEAFTYSDPSEIYAEYAALTGFHNEGTRDLDISAHATISAADYEDMGPFQWPLPEGTAEPSETRFFANGGFFTPDRRGRFIATPFREPASRTCEQFPLVLNTGRIRDQWHTMSRTAKTARLMSHYPEPFVEIHPEDAQTYGLRDADLAVVQSVTGTMTCRVICSETQRRGSVFVPMHWTGQLASNGRANTLVRPNRDPVSGQPELKYSAVSVSPYGAGWHAFATTLERPSPAAFHYTVLARAGRRGGWRMEAAGKTALEDWDQIAHELFSGANGDEPGPPLEILAYHDRASAQHRFAAFRGDRCTGLLFVSRDLLNVSRTWAIEQIGRDVGANNRLRLLAGRPGGEEKDRGPIVCACFDVGRNEIAAAIASGCTTVAAVGASVKAGTNCGSCRSEIARMIASVPATGEATTEMAAVPVQPVA